MANPTPLPLAMANPTPHRQQALCLVQAVVVEGRNEELAAVVHQADHLPAPARHRSLGSTIASENRGIALSTWSTSAVVMYRSAGHLYAIYPGILAVVGLSDA